MAKVYGNAGEIIQAGLERYAEEVRSKEFPQPQNYFGMDDTEFNELEKML
jgi:ketopantoate hydroxymethyltransferase